MNPRVLEVTACDEYLLKIEFTNKEIKYFDVKPYLNIGIFKELQDLNNFKRVKAFLGSIQWAGGQDLCPDMLWEESYTA